MSDEVVIKGYADLARDSKLRGDDPDAVGLELQDLGGDTDHLVAWLPGLARRQFFEWLEKADGREEGIYSDFSDRVASARGAARRPGDTQDRRARSGVVSTDEHQRRGFPCQIRAGAREGRPSTAGRS